MPQANAKTMGGTAEDHKCDAKFYFKLAVCEKANVAGPDLRAGANWAVAQGASTKTVKKIITSGNIQILFETDNLE